MIQNPNPAVPPAVVPPSPNEWPNQVRTITGITKELQATVHSVAHGMTQAFVGVTFVCFTMVKGMLQINGLEGLVVAVPDADHFQVNIDSSQFFNYTSGGYATIDTGIPPIEQAGFQIFNTPFQNIA